MKITFVMPGGGLAGGIRVAAVYADRLAKRGHDVHVVWERRRTPSRMARLRALSRGRWLRPRPQGSAHFDGLAVTQSVAAKPGPVRDGDVPDGDIVIATWWETAFAVAALSPEKGEKVYFVQHHEVHDHLPNHLSRGSYYLPLHKIAITKWLVDLMAEEYGDHNVDLVPNSVDTDLFFAPPREKNAEPKIGLLYAPAHFKGLDVSLRAIEAARAVVSDLRVISFGTGPVRRELPLPPGSLYVRSPAQEALRSLYGQCDVWLMGSRSEGFGLPLLEAMACRTPVISTRTGAAPEVVEDGVNGFLVDVEDSAAMADRIVEVLNLSPEAWVEMSEAALGKAQAYSWNDAVILFERALLRRFGADVARKVG